MEKDRDMGQAKRWDVCCCKCYWSDQCCEGCMVPQFECDDYTPLFADEIERLDYIEKYEYEDDLEGRVQEYEELIREMGGYDDYE